MSTKQSMSKKDALTTSELNLLWYLLDEWMQRTQSTMPVGPGTHTADAMALLQQLHIIRKKLKAHP